MQNYPTLAFKSPKFCSMRIIQTMRQYEDGERELPNGVEKQGGVALPVIN